MKLVIFSHGKESGPNGSKIQILRKTAEANGFETASIDYTNCETAAERVKLLLEFIESKQADCTVLVGSSMGGYVSTVVSNNYQLNGLFLLCPALYIQDQEYEVQDYHPKCDSVEIVHGWNDTVVPFETSIKFAQQIKAVLNLVDDNHRLEKSHSFLASRFDGFLKNMDC